MPVPKISGIFVCSIFGVLFLSACVSINDTETKLYKDMPFPPKRIFIIVDVGKMISELSVKSMIAELYKKLEAKRLQVGHHQVTGLEINRLEPFEKAEKFKSDYYLLIRRGHGHHENMYKGGRFEVSIHDAVNNVLYWKMEFSAKIGMEGKIEFGNKIADEIINEMDKYRLFSYYNKSKFVYMDGEIGNFL